MFDNLREMSDDAGLFEEADEQPFEFPVEERPEVRFLGMTAGQRLILSLLLLATIIVMGMSCLVVTGKVVFF
jgi:hypothetical protein